VSTLLHSKVRLAFKRLQQLPATTAQVHTGECNNVHSFIPADWCISVLNPRNMCACGPLISARCYAVVALLSDTWTKTTEGGPLLLLLAFQKAA
jgi:hypothetical protein